MTCRHKLGDPNCSSSPSYIRAEANRTIDRMRKEMEAMTPDSKNFEILEVEEHNHNLVLKVKYPNCAKCSYEGTKILVLPNCSLKDAIFWKEIDPHFADPTKALPKSKSPPPVARFPASQRGWDDAVEYAKRY